MHILGMVISQWEVAQHDPAGPPVPGKAHAQSNHATYRPLRHPPYWDPCLHGHGVTSPAPVPPLEFSGSTGRLPSPCQEHKEACLCRQRFGVRGALAAKLRALHIWSLRLLHFERSAVQPEGPWSHSASFRGVFRTGSAEYCRIVHFRVWVSIEGRVWFSRRVGGWSWSMLCFLLWQFPSRSWRWCGYGGRCRSRSKKREGEVADL